MPSAGLRTDRSSRACFSGPPVWCGGSSSARAREPSCPAPAFDVDGPTRLTDTLPGAHVHRDHGLPDFLGGAPPNFHHRMPEIPRLFRHAGTDAGAPSRAAVGQFMHNSLSAATACLESAPGMLRSIVTQPAEEKVMLLVFALLLLLVQFVSGRRVV